MRKIIAITAALALLAVPGAASAGKKPKPYKSETVTIATGHPVLNSASGSLVSVTGQEFLATCAIPGSNGLDGYVFEIPAEYQKINSYIEGFGASPAGAYDLDIYAFSADCQMMGALNAEGTDQSGGLLKGTAFVFVHNYLPGPLDVYFELKPL